MLVSLSFKDLITYAHFAFNRNFIVEFLCVNLDRPEMNCKGKCYLKKSIKKNREKENNVPNSNKDKKQNLIIFSTDLFKFHKVYKLVAKKNYCSTDINVYGSSYVNDVFHPPKYSL